MTTHRIDPEAVAIGKAVRGAIYNAGLTVADAAERSGITLTTFSRRLNGALPFTFPELVRIAATCGVRVSDIVRVAEGERDQAGDAA